MRTTFAALYDDWLTPIARITGGKCRSPLAASAALIRRIAENIRRPFPGLSAGVRAASAIRSNHQLLIRLHAANHDRSKLAARLPHCSASCGANWAWIPVRHAGAFRTNLERPATTRRASWSPGSSASQPPSPPAPGRSATGRNCGRLVGRTTELAGAGLPRGRQGGERSARRPSSRANRNRQDQAADDLYQYLVRQGNAAARSRC